jgi:Uma2 family endonuclease
MPATLTTRRFTVDEYYRMTEAGILGVGERVELIDGEIVQMAAIGSRHAGCVKRLNRLFVRGVEDRAIVQVQDPVRLSDLSEPQPDLAVLRPRTDDYTNAHPGPDDVLLVVEVADATVEVDRGTKAPLYAAAGIGEYWLVDLPQDEIQVFRTSTPNGYHDVRSYRRGDVLRPSALPGLEVPVADILP